MQRNARTFPAPGLPRGPPEVFCHAPNGGPFLASENSVAKPVRADCNSEVRTHWTLLGLVAWLHWFAPAAPAARLERWLYYSVNLWVDANVTNLDAVLTRAAQAGYTHVLLSDSKFCLLQNMDAHYFANVAHVKNTAADLG